MNSVVIAPFHGKLGELALIAGPEGPVVLPWHHASTEIRFF